MVMFSREVLASSIVALSVLAVASPVTAQQYGQSYNQQQDRYSYCQQQAARIAQYYGPGPSAYRPRSGLEQAARQSAAVDGIAWMAGASKKKRKKLRKKAALNGLLKGAIQNGIAKDREREARRRYQFELDNCMRAP